MKHGGKSLQRGDFTASVERVAAQLFVYRFSISGPFCDRAVLCSQHIYDRSVSEVSSVSRGTVNVVPESEFYGINLP
jgi:hypothetical protein